MNDERTRFVWSNGAFDVRLVSRGSPAYKWTALLFRAGDDVDPIDVAYVMDDDKFFGAAEVLDDLKSDLLHGAEEAEIDAMRQALDAWKDGRKGWTEVAP